jgi:hypothetical protein
MAGRAGRPKYDNHGESVILAKTADEADYLMEGYVLAKTERIWSKLAVERIMRGHVLATIASGFASSEQGVYEVTFNKTFYAYQFDVKAIKSVVDKILRFLHDEEMIVVVGDRILATDFGKRISELYIDPLSGVIIRDALKGKIPLLTEFSILHLISHTPDMGPIMRPYQREMDKLAVQTEEHRQELFILPPNEWDYTSATPSFWAKSKPQWSLTMDKELPEDKSWHAQRATRDLLPHHRKPQIATLKQLRKSRLQSPKQGIRSLSHELVKRGQRHKLELQPIVALEGVGRCGRIILTWIPTIEDLKHAPLRN